MCDVLKLDDSNNIKDITETLLEDIEMIDSGYKLSWWSARQLDADDFRLGYSYNSSKANKS